MGTDSIDQARGGNHVGNPQNLKNLFHQNNDPILDNQSHECQYYQIDEFQNKVQNLQDKFSTLSLNIRSFPGKKSEFEQLTLILISVNLNLV